MKRNVLIVDDDNAFRLSLADALTEFSEEFSTLTASNGKEALETLRSIPVSVLVTDLKMPVMDGFSLLAQLNRYGSKVPVIVMTAHATEEARRRLTQMGLCDCLEKPIDFHELVAAILGALKENGDRRIHGVLLPAFLQLVEMEKRTITLNAEFKGKRGRLFFREGRVVGAECGVLAGAEAALEIIRWNEAVIDVRPGCPRTDDQVGKGLGSLLMEAYNGRPAETELVVGEELLDVECAAFDDDTLTITGNPDEVPAEHSDETDEDAGITLDIESTAMEEDMSEMRNTLNLFTKLDGVLAACLVGRDGFLLDSSARSQIDTEMIGAIASAGFGSAESMGRQLGQGNIVLNMMEFEQGPVLFSPVGDEAFVVIVADTSANLGMIRLKLKKHAADLVGAVFA